MKNEGVCACPLLMHSMTFLSCSHVRSHGEQQAVMECRTDMVSALPELHTLCKCEKCSEGEIQVHGHTMGSAWASSVCVFEACLEGARCWWCWEWQRRACEDAGLGRKLGWSKCGDLLSLRPGPGHLQ